MSNIGTRLYRLLSILGIQRISPRHLHVPGASQSRFGRFCIIIALGAVMAACSGGGGGGGSAPAVDSLASPVNVRAQAGYQSVTLSWDAVAGADSYTIYMAAESGVSSVSYTSRLGGARLTGQTSPALISSLTNGTTYYFVVAAVRTSPTAIESAASVEVQATPMPSTPGVPQNLQAQASDRRVTLSWETVAGADSYNVYMATQSGIAKGNYTFLPGGARLTGRSNPALIEGLTNGTTYYFAVSAVTAGLLPFVEYESESSSEVQAMPHGLPGDTSPVTMPAGTITGTTANLNGNFTNPPGYTTSVWFEYGTTTAYGNITPNDSYLTSGTTTFSKGLTNLPQWTTIHYRLATQNSGGFFFGQDRTFTTLMAPTVLLADLDAPTEPVFDGTYLYWLEIYADRVRRYNVSTGEVSTIANVDFVGNNGAIALDAAHVYFVDCCSAIRRMDLDGNNLNHSFSTVALNPSQIVPHSTGLYVREEKSTEDSPGVWTLHQYISRISLDGATRTQLYERTGPNTSGFGGGMVVDDNYIYWADYYHGTVQRMPIGGGAPIFLANPMGSPHDLILDGNDLYVSTNFGIMKINVITGVMTEVFHYPGTGPLRMFKDGGTIFYTTGVEAGKIDLATGGVTRLVFETGYTSPPVATASYIYWIGLGNHYYPPLGTLNRIPRP